MIQLGEFNTLRVLRFRSNGCYLGDVAEEEFADFLSNQEAEDDPFGEGVLMPQKYVSDDLKVGDQVEVFIYNDSEDRLVATTEKPLITLNEFAPLKVKSVTNYGAFMDWGLSKDLLVPFAEQGRKLEEGETHVIFLYIDEETDRLVGSAKISNIIDNEEIVVSENEEVQLLIYKETPLGFQAIINDENIGLLYKSELVQPLAVGQYVTGYVKKVREDDKIDLSLEKQGYVKVEPNAEKILTLLKENNGTLPFNDKSNPENIKITFGMSKKTFKQAIGKLYKERQITISPKGIKLV